MSSLVFRACGDPSRSSRPSSHTILHRFRVSAVSILADPFRIRVSPGGGTEDLFSFLNLEPVFFSTWALSLLPDNAHEVGSPAHTFSSAKESPSLEEKQLLLGSPAEIPQEKYLKVTC